MYNKLMKLPKKVYLFTALAIFVAGGGTALTLKPDAKPIAITKTSAVVQPVEQKPQEQSDTATQPEAQPSYPVPQVTTDEPTEAVTNPYAEGTNAWYVWNRMNQQGRPLPTNWGNVGTWSTVAMSQGRDVGLVAQVGSIAQLSNRAVGIVESVNADGTVSVWSGPNDTVLLTAQKASTIRYIY